MIRIFKTEDGMIHQKDEAESGCWIALTDPTATEILEIANKFEIDPDHLKAPLDEEERSRIESEDHYSLILVDIPAIEERNEKDWYVTIPMGIIMTEDMIVTVCLEDTPVLTAFMDGRVRDFYTYMKTRFILQILYKNASLYLQYLRIIDKKSEVVERELHKSQKNRELIAEILMDRAGLKGGEAFHMVHNYIYVEEKILRKGAVSAKRGERLLIPVNMRDGSILAVGRGNPEWNDSAPHGAGRIMSRMEAKRTLDLEEYRRAMEGIYTTSVNEHTLDEAPMVYKSLEEILETVGETVDIVDVMKPVYNFKFHGWHRNAAEEKTEDVHD